MYIIPGTPYLIIDINQTIFLEADARDHKIKLFRKHERSGRPIGDGPLIETLGLLLDRKLKPKKPENK